MNRRINILVAFNHSVAFDRRAFVGVATAANERGEVRLIERLSNVPWRTIVETHQIHGVIIARAPDASQVDLAELGIPFVSVADVAELADREHVVAMDEAAIGAMAAKHFLDAGYQQFAVCTRPGLYRTFAMRIGSFIEEIRSAGWPCAEGPLTPERAHSQDNFEDETSWAADAARWIAELPKPLAVFAPYDYHARVVVNVAQQAELRVPEDVAVLGVDDDEVYCMTTFPQLSSVVTPGRQIGQIAFGILLRAIRGEDGVPRRTLIPPPSVMVRGSSSDFAIQDPEVIAAVRFIRENAPRGASVEQVADHVLVSRRTLERRFMATLSHTIQDEMRRAKVHRARRLLIDTDLSYSDVAKRSGFSQQQQMNRVIKSATGQTPAQIRKVARVFRPA